MRGCLRNGRLRVERPLTVRFCGQPFKFRFGPKEAFALAVRRRAAEAKAMAMAR